MAHIVERPAPAATAFKPFVPDEARLPELTVPNMGARGESPPSFFGAYGEWMQTPPPSWADIGWLRVVTSHYPRTAGDGAPRASRHVKLGACD